jgi:hypothetical protein
VFTRIWQLSFQLGKCCESVIQTEQRNDMIHECTVWDEPKPVERGKGKGERAEEVNWGKGEGGKGGGGKRRTGKDEAGTGKEEICYWLAATDHYLVLTTL